MKKRVLSVFLALALCFTMFAGMGFAAGRVENNLAKAQKVLDSALDSQKAVINNAANAIEDTSIDAEPWLTLIKGAVEDGGLLEGIFNAEMALNEAGQEDQMVVLPYFLIRYLDDSMEAGTITVTENGVISTAVEKFRALNEKYDTTGLGLKASLDMFGDYGDELTNIFTEMIQGDNDDEVISDIGAADKAEVWAIAKDQAEQDAVKVLDYAQKFVFSTSTDENADRTIVENFKKMMDSDRLKKDAALLIGQDILDEVSSGLVGKLKGYISVDLVESIVNPHKAKVFDADKDVAIAEIYTVMKEFAADMESTSDPFMSKLVGLIADRGLTPSGLVKSLELTMVGENGLDPTNGFQVVWYDLALGRAMKVTDLSGDKVVSPEEPIDLNLNHRIIDNQLGQTFKYNVSGQFSVVSNRSDVKVVDNNEGTIILDYDPKDIEPGGKVVLTVYRGKGEVAQGDEVYRYIREYEFDLESEEVAANITIDKAVEQTYGRPSTVFIRGTAEGVKAFNLSVTRPDGSVYVFQTATPDAFAKGYTFGIGENDPEGEYTITAAVQGGPSDVAKFIVKDTEPDRTLELAPVADTTLGGQVFVKGTSSGYKAIIVSIVDKDNKVLSYETVTPETFAKGITYTVPEDRPLGEYKVIAGDAKFTDDTTFWVKAASGNKVLVYEAYDPKTIADKLVGTAMSELGLPATLTLSNDEGDKVENVKIDWTKAVYDANSTEVQTLVGTYAAPSEYDLGGDADGKVEVKVQLVKPAPERKLTLDTTGLNGTVYSKGEDSVVIKGTSVNFKAIVIAIDDENGNRFVYETVTPEQYKNGVKYDIPADAADGTYTVVVGDGQYSDNQTSTFVVKAASPNDIVKKVYTPEEITSKKVGTRLTNLGLPAKVTLTTRDGKTFEADVDWTNAQYDSKSRDTQTLVGQIVLPEEYKDYEFSGIDDKVRVDVTLKSSGPVGPIGPGSDSHSVATKFNDDETAYSVDHINVKGTTDSSNVTLTLVGPNGETLKTVTIKGSEFKAGYAMDISDIAPLGYGKYVLSVKETPNGPIKDTYDFELKAPITVDSFNKKDHMNYIVGYEDGTVRPNANISREETVTILFRLLTEDARKDWLTESTSKFSDVESGRWSMTAIATLSKANLVNGYEDGTFRPANAITRAEFAALTARFALKDAGTVTSTYSDIKGHWAEADIMAVSNAGWFKGSDGKFRPDDKITRAEAVTVINRILERDKADKESFSEDIVKFSDLNESDWFYTDMVEATNSHDYEKNNTKETWTKANEATDWSTYEK